jgi:hypothetical protein
MLIFIPSASVAANPLLQAFSWFSHPNIFFCPDTVKQQVSSGFILVKSILSAHKISKLKTF